MKFHMFLDMEQFPYRPELASMEQQLGIFFDQAKEFAVRQLEPGQPGRQALLLEKQGSAEVGIMATTDTATTDDPNLQHLFLRRVANYPKADR